MAAVESNLPVDFKQICAMFDDFRKEVDEDFQSPGISHFQNLMPKVKKNVLSLEQVWCKICTPRTVLEMNMLIGHHYRVFIRTRRVLLM